jgi:3'(2'), 5'-bisphosphate nucleotidase
MAADYHIEAVLAAQIAETAGKILRAIQRSHLLHGKALGKAGDALSHDFIIQALAAARPDDYVLSEEGAASPERLDRRQLWIVDPLDGTREFSEGRTDYAVHVAWVVDGRAVAGAISLPGLDETFNSAFPPSLADSAPAKLLISRSRTPDIAVTAAAQLGLELAPMGSAGAKTAALLRNEAMAYVHAGGQYEWDSAAPVAVATAAGLHVSRLDGSPLIYNRPDPYLPDLVVARQDIAPRLLQVLAKETGKR